MSLPSGVSISRPAVVRSEVLTRLWTVSSISTVMSRIFSYPAALAVGLITVTVLNVTARFRDPDLWWHLRIGQIIWNTHAIPSADSFSFTALGHPWVAHEWLAELSLFAAYHYGGYSGLMLWLALFGSLVFLIVYLLCFRVTSNALIAFRGGIIAFCFGGVGLGLRPLLIGHVLLAGELLILELARTRNARWLWLLPPVFALWVNCHGSHVFGLVVLAVYFACAFLPKLGDMFVLEDWDPRSRLLLGCALALSTAALFINPIGIRLVLYPFDVLFRQGINTGFVEEWFPPDLKDVNTLLLLAAIGAILLLFAARKLSIREVALACIASGMALQHRRMLFLFGILTAPILSHYGWAREKRRAYPLANAALIGACLLAIVWLFPDNKALKTQLESQSPVAAVQYLRQAHVGGPLLNEFQFGGYLIWSMPEAKVFIDGRTDLFDWTGVLREYLRWALLQDDPKVLLDKYGIRTCLLFRSSAIARVMPYLPGWKRVYSDDLAVVFAR